jgi:hypothetical protein
MNHLSEDEYIQKLLRKKDKAEALKWLSGLENQRNIGELSYKKSMSLVRKLYAMGALEVIATDISEHAGLASTDTLIATLPEDPAHRELLFEWNNDRILKMGYESGVDRGQKHMLIWFD